MKIAYYKQFNNGEPARLTQDDFNAQGKSVPGADFFAAPDRMLVRLGSGYELIIDAGSPMKITLSHVVGRMR